MSPENPEVVEVSKSEPPIHPKLSEISGVKSNGTDILGKKSPKVSIYLGRLSPFRKFGKIAVR